MENEEEGREEGGRWREKEVCGSSCTAATALLFLRRLDVTASGRRSVGTQAGRTCTPPLLGRAQVLWVASWYAAKKECEMFPLSLHALPSLVSGRDGNPIMSHVELGPHKL